MLTNIQKREKCISCATNLPSDIVHIGSQYPSAIFLDEKNKSQPSINSSSLNLTRCTNKKCNLVQLSSEYKLDYVFDNYPYQSGITATMQDILKDVINDALKVAKLKSESIVLDIGGNDGTMLGLISTPVRARINIDAAKGIDQTLTAPDYQHIHAQFDANVYKKLNLPNPKLITSIAMFYHLDKPLEFCQDIVKIMDADTVWVLQMTYLGTMLEDNIFDNIVHEHVAYYSLFSVEALLKKVGLIIADAKLVKSYGGSLRLFIVKDKEKFPKLHWRKYYSTVQEYEKINLTNSFEALYSFNSRIQLVRKTLKDLIDYIINESGPIWGFGASTKGNMILQFLGINYKQIPYILDNSIKKIGCKTTGSLIPIVDESIYLKKLPKNLLILPYYYTDTFIQIIKRKLKKGEKINLIIPLPYPKILTIQGDKIEK